MVVVQYFIVVEILNLVWKLDFDITTQNIMKQTNCGVLSCSSSLNIDLCKTKPMKLMNCVGTQRGNSRKAPVLF